MSKSKSVNYNHIKAALDKKPKMFIDELCAKFPDVGGTQLLAWMGRWAKERELTKGRRPT